MKVPRAVAVLAVIWASSPAVFAVSILDIGTQYRLRGISINNTDYGQNPDQNFSYYSQRALAHVGARFSPNIEMMTQFQAIGVAGSSAPINNVAAAPGASRYPNVNFTPWVQWAYLKARNLYDTPNDLTVGRQPILWGDGFILSDDDLGFTGLRLQSRLPIWDLQSDLFTFKTSDSLQGNGDTTLYGLELTKPAQAIRYHLAALIEEDASGQTQYIRASQNPASISTSTNTNASRITRVFYDARVEGRLLEGGFYKAELALQNGHVTRDPKLASADLSGYAFLMSAGLFTHISKYGPIEVHGVFGLASGDSGGGTDSAFHPDFGHRFDGLERSGFGEFYGATLYDAYPSTASANGLPPGHSGIRVIGGGVTTHPTSLLSIGIDYFVYNSLQQNPTAFPTSSTDSSLGSEFDFGAGFAYTNYLTFRASFAFFSPGTAYLNRNNAQRYLLEAIGRF